MSRRRSWKGRHKPVPQSRPSFVDLRKRCLDGLNVRREFLRRPVPGREGTLPIQERDAFAFLNRVYRGSAEG